MASENSTGGVATDHDKNSASLVTTDASSSAGPAVSASESSSTEVATSSGSSSAAPAAGSSGAESMTLRTLQQYRLMAADPQKVEPLTRDGTVAQFLAYVLEDRDEAIVVEALHTIVLLCASSSSRRQLARTYGLEPALRCLKMKDSGPEVLALADRALSELNRSAAPPAAAGATSSPGAAREKPRPAPRPKHKVVTLHVTGLVTDGDREELESLLVRVRGMISIVFDMGRGRCTCRVRDHVTVGTLGSAVDRTESMAAYQVVRGADGDSEELVPVSKRAKALERPQEEKLPEYLPEDDGDAPPAANAMAPGGFFKQASGWLSSASSYLSQSFYW
ncbi:Armadillo repeat-containing protein 1 [Amphibalanus amphitrite]|uniref:Armadillo repeat-containing protein 1 n=1 Tax=Amphibalanus amphitrite TaxID=1232801 RepID=A0A6A4W4N3_AMPAM|nr:armadillo repeat-containing protein 1-like [Amphibalanus amphitrite]XP_043216370.1 armadillo repeat-containing protein 1-like [Amphibalanus amphitrite]XP_043216371.1 armadillo repeat-containing protein 1-like [Amphibalanus amphitrite]KAF0300269.1 Armadillo repeat-containing protein 1 [Amphibalanus amphitrite]